MTTHASAPGKIILLGEHAVVYGHPALAVPVSQVRAQAFVGSLPDQPMGRVVIDAPDIGRHGDLADLPPSDPLAAVVRLTLAACGDPPVPAFSLAIQSDIPVAAGLGSGAAVSVAVTRAVSAFVGVELALEQQSEIAFEVENIHHGTPSGVDNTVVTFAAPVYFVKGRPPEPFAIKTPFRLIIADSGVASPTAQAVGQVRRAYETQPEKVGPTLEAIGDITRAGRLAIAEGDLARLGELMDSDHARLSDLGVSTPELDRLVSAARAAGALGAKLSGGGLGGNMIALLPEKDRGAVAEALTAAGAARLIVTRVESP